MNSSFILIVDKEFNRFIQCDDAKEINNESLSQNRVPSSIYEQKPLPEKLNLVTFKSDSEIQKEEIAFPDQETTPKTHKNKASCLIW